MISRRTFLAAIAAAPAAARQARPVIDLRAVERERVLRAAARYLGEQPITITSATSSRSAGGLHDYFSEGDYWWPDPENPNGPYIQRDGMTNPDNFVAHRHALIRLSLHVPALTSAWLLTRDRRYAQHAAAHLRAWFMDDKTRMNPHLLYAQAIKGRFTGRGIGIIDTLHLPPPLRRVGARATGVRRALAHARTRSDRRRSDPELLHSPAAPVDRSMKLVILAAAVLLAVSGIRSAPLTRGIGQDTGGASAIVRSEFLFETAPFPSVHASTIVESGDGLVAAWFGGTREGAADVGIWSSRQVNGAWTAPIEVATGTQSDGTRHPCWNPVLFRTADNSIRLFYKVGPNPRTWWGMSVSSTDNGRTWNQPVRLPDGVLGPIKNKPVRLSDGTIISPSSTESTDQPSLWRVHFERSSDGGKTWTIVRPAIAPGSPELNSIQPSILTHGGTRLQALGRTRSQRVFETWSDDGGRTWSAIALTDLPNPSAGTDAVTLRDGRHVIVYNHTVKGRSPLNVAVSADGKAWDAALVLEREAGEYSYPAVIQTADGLVHVTYTWRRERVRHVTIDPARLQAVRIVGGEWPASMK